MHDLYTSSYSPPPVRSNLIVVVADTLRYDFPPDGSPVLSHLSAFDGLLEKGTVFERLLASSPWSVPSHNSLLNGASPWELPGSGSHGDGPDHKPLSQHWREAGGESAAFCANFLVSPSSGVVRDYDVYNPGWGAASTRYAVAGLFGLGYDFLLSKAHAVEVKRPASRVWKSLARGFELGAFGVTKELRHLIDGHHGMVAMKRYLERRDHDKPLHLFLNLMEMHEPYMPASFPSSRHDELPFLSTFTLAHFGDSLAGYAPLRQSVGEGYISGLRRLDCLLKRAIQLFRANNLLDDSYLLFLSDHGQCLGEYGYLGHGRYLHLPLVHVPAVLFHFESGLPTAVPLRIPDWIDHRHLHDLLCSLVGEVSQRDIDSALSDSLRRRGPATSFCSAVMQPQLTVFGPKGATRALVRVMSGNSVSMAERRSNPSDPEAKVSITLERSSDEIIDSTATRLLDKIAEDQGDTGDVETRLGSWGYT